MSTKKTPETKAKTFSLITSMLTIALTLIGLVILKVHIASFLLYTQIMCITVALINLLEKFSVSLLLRVQQNFTLTKHFLFWAGFLAAGYLILMLVQFGVATDTASGLFLLILLSATLFFYGILSKFVTALVGVTIGLMTATAIISQANLIILTPLAIVMGLVIFSIRKKG